MAQLRVSADSLSAKLTVAVSLLRRAMAGEDPVTLSRDLGSRALEVCALFLVDVNAGDFSFPSLRGYIDGAFSDLPLYLCPSHRGQTTLSLQLPSIREEYSARQQEPRQRAGG